MRAHTLNQLRTCKPPSTSPNSTASTPLPTRPKAQPPHTSLLTPEHIFLKQTDYRNSIETILVTSKNAATTYTLTPTHGNSQNNNTPQNPSIAPPESPSVVYRRPKHSSMFHVKQMYFYGSKTDILHNTPLFTHRLALLHRACPTPFAQSFPKTHHIARTSTHTFYARQTPFDTNAHDRQPPPSSSHTIRRARITARYMPLSTLAAQAARRIPRRSHKPDKSAPSATCYNERRNRRVLLANRMPLNRQAVAACSFYTQKPR